MKLEHDDVQTSFWPRREGKHNFYRVIPERFEGLLDMVFSTIPGGERKVHFEKYVLALMDEAEFEALAANC